LDGNDINLYGYVLNNPINDIDPLGLRMVIVDFSQLPEIKRFERIRERTRQIWMQISMAAFTIFAPSPPGFCDVATNRISNPSRLLAAPEGPNPWSGNIISEITTEPLSVTRFAGNPKSQWVMIESSGGTPSTLSINPSNPANRISSSVIPAGTRIQSGTAAAIEEWGGIGGAQQIQILDNTWQEMLWEVKAR